MVFLRIGLLQKWSLVKVKISVIISSFSHAFTFWLLSRWRCLSPCKEYLGSTREWKKRHLLTNFWVNLFRKAKSWAMLRLLHRIEECVAKFYHDDLSWKLLQTEFNQSGISSPFQLRRTSLVCKPTTQATRAKTAAPTWPTSSVCKLTLLS